MQKIVLPSAYRYSEDIDLVQTTAGAAGPLLDQIRKKLDPWLGKPNRDRGPGNVTLTYRFESEIPPIRPLRLKIEINTREHFALNGLQRHHFAVSNLWFTGDCDLVTFDANELMATKLRALYQRRKGRDLFDLWLCLDEGLIDPASVIECFLEYMRREGHTVSRAQFVQNLHDKQQDRAFMGDIRPLLRSSVAYDSAAAMKLVQSDLIELLPEDPRHGHSGR